MFSRMFGCVITCVPTIVPLTLRRCRCAVWHVVVCSVRFSEARLVPLVTNVRGHGRQCQHHKMSVGVCRLRAWLLVATAIFTLQLIAAMGMAAHDVWCWQRTLATGAASADSVHDYAPGTRCAVQPVQPNASLRTAWGCVRRSYCLEAYGLCPRLSVAYVLWQARACCTTGTATGQSRAPTWRSQAKARLAPCTHVRVACARARRGRAEPAA
jgi:hypothetical protein